MLAVVPAVASHMTQRKAGISIRNFTRELGDVYDSHQSKEVQQQCKRAEHPNKVD